LFLRNKRGRTFRGRHRANKGGNQEHENHSNSERFLRAARVRVKDMVENCYIPHSPIGTHKLSNKQETFTKIVSVRNYTN
jgi:hypothetical protein